MKKFFIIMLFAVVSFEGRSQSIAALKKDMYGIASDATEGRFTGSAGYQKAAKYVKAQLNKMGIATQMQTVPFTWDDYSGSKLIIGNKSYQHKAQNFIVSNRGIAKPGKWIVLSVGDSVKGNPAGIMWLPAQQQAADWETTVIRQYRFNYMHYVPDGKAVTNGIPGILLSPLLSKTISRGDSVIVQLKYRSVDKVGYNVIGIMPGKGKAVIIGAHLDHIGHIGKHIYNGANDDASGCVAELGVARLLATHHSKHPVVFAFFCGEELNLKGSRWFADHLPVKQSHILMAINLEQLGSKHRSFSGVWALGDTVFKTSFYKAGKNFTAQNLQFSAKDSVKDVLSNTDTYSFMHKHIPSLLLGSGGFDEHHTIQDKINLIDFKHLQKATLLLKNLIKMYR